MKKTGVLMAVLLLLSVVLYCEKEHGSGRELADFGETVLPAPPAWAKHGAIYQVFPRVFTKEGTFSALQKKLDYIKSLDVDIVWLMPIYPIGEKGRKGTLGSPYSIRDFRKINPAYGTERDLHNLVDGIHQRGMKVILGMVPNHSSNDNVLMKAHPDWFMRDENGNFTREVADWSDVTDFNYDNPELRQYMIDTFNYWIREFDIDGYRMDVAGMVPYDFWKEAIPAMHRVKSDIYLLAEWEDPKILIAGFNSDYDWTLYHMLRDIRKGKKRTASAIGFIAERDSLYPVNSLPMRFLENHDEARSLHEFGPAAIQAYATFLFTVPGIPLIYAGQEFGETEKPSLFEKSTLDWQDADTALEDMYTSLIKLRKKYSCFTTGNFIQMPVASMSGSAGAFIREDDSTVALVVTNLQRTTAGQVVISISPELKNRMKGVKLNLLDKPGEIINWEKVYFDKLAPFTTLVYIGRKA